MVGKSVPVAADIREFRVFRVKERRQNRPWRDRKIAVCSYIIFGVFIKSKFIPNRAENIESAQMDRQNLQNIGNKSGIFGKNNAGTEKNDFRVLLESRCVRQVTLRQTRSFFSKIS